MRDGRVLTGFAKNDFRIFDDDSEQPMAAFSATEQALDVVLLFGVGSSMRPCVKQVATVARQSLGELRRY